MIVRPATAALNPFLKTNGHDIRNNNGQGDVVPLRGENLGSWLLMEAWMSPLDSSGLGDNYSVLQTLNNRFGVTVQESLIKTYQENWITTGDLDNIRAMGENFIRVPFWWANVQRLDGTWRADAFDKLDWIVTNAWQRGIYVLIDMHGVPGGQSTDHSTGHIGQNQYWSSSTYQAQTLMIWTNVAAHFKGNPGVAGYDLMNEPTGAPSQAALWTAYRNIYQAIRAVDPDHMIFIEGCWAGSGLNWQWDVLPPPTTYGWTNVVYEMHAYASGISTELGKQVNDFNNHQSWNVPCLIGEFNWENNTVSDWQNATTQFDNNGMSWCHWAYKAISGGVPNSWGIYDPVGTWPAKPNIPNDSITTISNDWSAWKTTSAFGVTSFLRQTLGGPLAVADFYTNSGVLTVPSGSGVLANDQDVNVSQSSLTAVLVANPANGQLALNSNGSFTYTPNNGFNGTDSFRYRVNDGFVYSANIATVSIQVGQSAPLIPAKVQVETAADGSGAVVSSQNLATGSSTTVYAIIRDASGVFITNSSATWSLVNQTGGVVSGDLVAAGDNKSATFTAHQLGSAVIQAVASGFTGQSGTITAIAGPVTQLIWTTQPGNATTGLPFGTQPVLKTADQAGNPSTSGLAAVQNVVVTLSAGTGPLVGTTNYNIGTAGSNGVVTFSNLEIDSTGAGKQITASAFATVGSPVSGMAVWLDANNAATVLTNGSGSVTSWLDLSGNGNNFNTVLGTGTAILYTNATTPSGRRTVTFPGVGSLMNATYRNTGTDLSVFVVCKKTTSGNPGGNTGPIGASDGVHNDYNATTCFNLNYQNGGVHISLQRNTGQSDYAALDPGSAYHDEEGVFSSSAANIWVNGNAGGTGAGTGTFGITNTAVGGRLIGVAGQNYFAGDVAELLIYSSPLSAANRQANETYLSNKWMTASSGVALSSAVSSPFTVQATGSQTNSVVGIANNGNGTVLVTFAGTAGAQYYVQATTSLVPPVVWSPVVGSTNTVTSGNGQWTYQVTNANPQQFYRSVVANP